jgi:hypothetical protein
VLSGSAFDPNHNSFAYTDADADTDSYCDPIFHADSFADRLPGPDRRTDPGPDAKAIAIPDTFTGTLIGMDSTRLRNGSDNRCCYRSERRTGSKLGDEVGVRSGRAGTNAGTVGPTYA